MLARTGLLPRTDAGCYSLHRSRAKSVPRDQEGAATPVELRSRPADCVAWGSWNGDAGGVGTPYAATSGLRRNEAVTRDVGGNGLQDTDDTDDSAADFDPAIPAPQNNAGQLGTIPSSTCGNSEIEALEECDDGNTADGDACSSTCTAVDDVFVDGFESP